MKLKGRRESTNVDDIQKQKPKPDMAPSMFGDPEKGIRPGQMQFGNTQVSTTPPGEDKRINYDDKGVKMAKKVGMHKMESAAEADHKKNEKAKASREKKLSDAVDEVMRKQKNPFPATSNLTTGSSKNLSKEIWSPKKQGTNY